MQSRHCGHIIRINDEEVSGSFEFSHPYFASWTIIGWFVALVWSASRVKKEEVPA